MNWHILHCLALAIGRRAQQDSATAVPTSSVREREAAVRWCPYRLVPRQKAFSELLSTGIAASKQAPSPSATILHHIARAERRV